MSRALCLVVLVAALSAVTSSTAGAVTWHVTGDTAFTATTGFRTLTTNPSFGFAGLYCAGLDVSATAVTGTTTTAVGPPITGTLSFTSCSWSMTNPAGVDCVYRFTPFGQTGGQVGGVVTGQTDTTCSVYLGSTKVCHAAGVLTTTYFNPSGGAAGRLTVTPSTLTMTNAGAGSCVFGSPSPLGFHETPLPITSATGGPAPHTGPVFTRTA